MRISYEIVKETVKKCFLNVGLNEEQAEICASIHTQSSADGVESHGLNRIPRFVQYVQKGWINLEGYPKLVAAKGAVENYDGQLGIGVINATVCAERAIQLAKEHGIGCVTLKNTTHWMRGGTYAWKMAEAGMIGMSWINTESCMPLWGSDKPGVGNNPFCIAIPREDGPVVVDMAMSQYAYGKLGVYRLAGKELPYPGGFDKEGNLTSNPDAIEDSGRILPTGYWKGSSMALALDLAAAMLANGNSGVDMDMEGRGSCTSCCQIFIAFDPYLFGTKEDMDDMVERRIQAVHNSHPVTEGDKVAYPGEHTIERRKESMEKGIRVEDVIWKQIEALAAGILETQDIASKGRF